MIKVLLIEDDRWLGELQASILAKAGYEVAMCQHGLAAIAAIDKSLPDVIVADVLLDGSTVFALLNELQSHDDTKNIPIIICTNLAEQLNVKSLEAYNVKKVVNKTTMAVDEIVAAVRSVTI